MELKKEFGMKMPLPKGSLACLFAAMILLSIGLTLPATLASPTLELVGEVPPTAGISIWHVDGMEVLDSNPDELFFTSKNQGAGCGGGTPASVWKMTLDPNTGDMISVEHIQSLSQIQTTRGVLFESSDGTLFTGGGWCGYKPAYYSTDGGETWQTADSGPVHPPNSVYSFVEFNGDVYLGTGYLPYHGQVYRWLGDGNWELVIDIGIVRNVIGAMVVYDNQLFVGSDPYGYSGAACESTIPVLVSSDGNTFDPTAGIPGCCGVGNLLVVDNQLLARVHDRNSGSPFERYMYRWNDISETWEELAAYNLGWYGYGMASHNGVIYTYGQAPSDASAGIYQSIDLGVTWQQIAVLENPDASSMTIHDDILYIGTWHDANNKAYIYRICLNCDVDVEAGADQTADEGATVSFSGSFTAPCADVDTIEWDFGDGDTATGTLTPTHAYGDNGVYTVTLTVTDEDGRIGSDTLTVTVNNVAPIVDPLPTVTIVAGDTVSFTGHATDPGSDDITFEWSWEDGSACDKTTTYLNAPPDTDPYPSPEINPRDVTESASCVYENAGVYTVTLTVTDDDGGVGSDSSTFNVKYNIGWLPPITTKEEFQLKDGSTLPIKFNATNCNNEFVSDTTVKVEVKDTTGDTWQTFVYGEGDDFIRIDTSEPSQPLYICNLHTRELGMPLGDYTIGVSFNGVFCDSIGFTLAEHGVGKGKGPK